MWRPFLITISFTVVGCTAARKPLASTPTTPGNAATVKHVDAIGPFRAVRPTGDRVYLAAALLLGAQFTRHAIALRKKDAPAHLPMQVFRYSVNYLMWLFAALLLDHFVKIRFAFGA